MRQALQRGFVALCCAAIAPTVSADSIAGMCPDGSAFIVQRAADTPCARARFVAPSDLPPLRPQMLPKPYMWYVDEEARDRSNPYNLLEDAARLRELRAAQQLGSDTASAGPTAAPLAIAETAQPAPTPTFSADDLGGLVRLIALRQQIAPATLHVADASGREELRIHFAHAQSVEDRVLAALGSNPSQSRVLVFYARAVQPTDFHPNFLIVQGGATFRPDPSDRAEVEFLVGTPGELDAGLLALGYLVVPARFDPSEPYDIYWNDRSISAILQP